MLRYKDELSCKTNNRKESAHDLDYVVIHFREYSKLIYPNQIIIHGKLNNILISGDANAFDYLMRNNVDLQLMEYATNNNTFYVRLSSLNMIKSWILNPNSSNFCKRFYSTEFIDFLLYYLKNNNESRNELSDRILKQILSLLLLELNKNRETIHFVFDSQDIIQRLVGIYLDSKKQYCSCIILQIFNIILSSEYNLEENYLLPMLNIFKLYQIIVSKEDEFLLLCKLGIIISKRSNFLLNEFCNTALPEYLFNCFIEGSDITNTGLFNLLSFLLKEDHAKSNDIAKSIDWNLINTKVNNEFVYLNKNNVSLIKSYCKLIKSFCKNFIPDEIIVESLLLLIDNSIFETQLFIINTLSSIIPNIPFNYFKDNNFDIYIDKANNIYLSCNTKNQSLIIHSFDYLVTNNIYDISIIKDIINVSAPSNEIRILKDKYSTF